MSQSRRRDRPSYQERRVAAAHRTTSPMTWQVGVQLAATLDMMWGPFIWRRPGSRPYRWGHQSKRVSVLWGSGIGAFFASHGLHRDDLLVRIALPGETPILKSQEEP